MRGKVVGIRRQEFCVDRMGEKVDVCVDEEQARVWYKIVYWRRNMNVTFACSQFNYEVG